MAPTTSPEALWAKLQAIQQAEMATLKRNRQELEDEKAAMNSLKSDASNSIVTFNVGGEIMQAHRETLCQAAGSSFSALFSGRWEDHCARDSEGRIFLDHDPKLIRMIVNYLRAKRIEDPFNPIDPPIVHHVEDRKLWLSLLNYYGLKPFFTPTYRSIDVSSVSLVPENQIYRYEEARDAVEITFNHSQQYNFVACATPVLATAARSTWKVTINALPGRYWLFLGIVGSVTFPYPTHNDASSYGWATQGQIYTNGSQSSRAGWNGLTEGRSYLFMLHNSRLLMFSVAENKCYVIDEVSNDESYIHFSSGSLSYEVKLTLEALNESEFLKLVDVQGQS